MTRGRSVLCGVFSFLSACGGGSATAPPPPADAGDDARPDAAGGDAALDGGGSDQARVMAAALQGAWHAETASGDGGAPMVLRRRFVDQTYYELWHSADLICAESGGFTVVDGKVTFTPDRHLGFPACAFAVAHVEEAEAVDGGITFVRDGTSTRYMPIAPVPKLFATLEVHNGDFASDATLPGSNPFAKADAFCNASLVKPDGLSYKALLVDGIHRAAVPAIDWVLRPNTTYYQPNGVVNSFRTGADGLTNPFPNNPTDPWSTGYAWCGLAYDFSTGPGGGQCAGWTSSSASLAGRVAQPDYAQFALASSVSDLCNDTISLLCVSQ